ncbi:MAG: zinc-dependent peptidase [Phycisphaerales bacterium]|nr:zinc-dependent peptidase [Phycisphaerales bacterium]
MSLLSKHHRRKLLAEPFPSSWEAVLEADYGTWTCLSDADRARLRDIIRILVDEKYWEGCSGVEIDDRIRVLISAMAGMLLLDRDHGYYHNVRTILVYPEAYMQQQELVGRDGLVHTGSANLGEAWFNGPVIVSWKDALEAARNPGRGLNVVYHEFAHTLDMLTGMTNGTPPMRERAHYARWHEVMTSQFSEIRNVYERGGRDVIRPYGVTNVAEFFAVTTEVFFDAPAALQMHRGDLYDQFSLFYGQDPVQRFPGASHG